MAESVTVEVMTIETESLIQEIGPIMQRALELQITDSNSYQMAAQELLGIKAKLKLIDAKFDPGIKKSYEAYKYAKNLKDQFIAAQRLSEAEITYKTKLIAYQQAENRKQKIAEAEAEEKARKAREQAEKDAKKAEKNGHPEKAQAIMENIPAVIIPQKETPKIQGISTKEIWHAEITDIAQVDRKYLIENMPLLNKMAQAMKDPALAPKGVKFVKKDIIAAGGTR